jgi:L-2,4-diaminobutyrate decarboxylase
VLTGPDPGELHRLDPDLARAILAAAQERLAADPPPLGEVATPAEVAERAGVSITPEGLGGEAALAKLTGTLLPLTTRIDHRRYFSFIPTAPTPDSVLVDVLAGLVYAGSWLEGAGTVHAENEALRWLANLAGFPPGAGGCFVQGGTNGNLSALVAARRARRGRVVLCSDEAHSSVRSSAAIMGVEAVAVETDRDGRLHGAAVRAALTDDVFAVVATAGTTNLGLVDDLAGIATACRDAGAWMHVDGAYGAAALCAPSARGRFAGIELADSLIVDPHKWLFAPFDSCALLYRDPAAARAAHRQSADYLQALYLDEEGWNPSDYGVHLTRRPRGLAFWFSLAVHGTDAYAVGVERTLALTREAAGEVRAREELELLAEPELSVVAFARRGWEADDYQRWSMALREAGTAFVLPTTVRGRAATRLAFVNPRSTIEDVRIVLDSMR